MSSYLIRGSHIVTRVISDSSTEIIKNGALLQSDGEIVDVGGYEEMKERYPTTEVVGSGTQVVMPGLINTHHHVGLTPFQLGAPDLSLELWIAERMATRHVDNYLDTLYCAIQMIESGITTVMHNQGPFNKSPDESHLEMGRGVLRAYQDSGMRAAFSVINIDQNHIVYQEDQKFLATLPQDLARRIDRGLKFNGIPQDDYFSLFVDLFEQFGRNKPNQRIMHFISPGNVQWCSDSLLRACKEFAGRYNTGIHIHLQESIYQKMYGLRTFGKTPLAHLDELGFLGPEVSCAHCVWLTESDIGIMEKTGTMVCHNASSNLRLKSGIAPLNRMLSTGVTVGIGIDEAGINDDNDILQEMRLVQKLHRVPGVASLSPTSHQILKMATINGSKATLFDNRVGTLEIGKRADMILVNLDHIAEPYLDPSVNILDAILHRGRGLDVDTTIVDGEILMRNRRMQKVNKEDVWNQLKGHLAKQLEPHEVERKALANELSPYVQQFYNQWHLEGSNPHYFYNEST